MNKNLLKKRVGNIYSVKYECRFTSDYCTTSPSAYNFYRRLFSFSFPFFFFCFHLLKLTKKKKSTDVAFSLFFFLNHSSKALQKLCKKLSAKKKYDSKYDRLNCCCCCCNCCYRYCPPTNTMIQ